MGMKTLSGQEVDGFAFGCMQFGGNADEAAAHGMYAACRDAGIVHFDTAHAYQGGETDRILGRLIGHEREDVFVATKAGNDKNLSATVIAKEFDETRKRIGVDMVDLFYLHQWDGDTPLDEPLEVIARLKQDGLVRHVGLSNFAAWQVMKARRIADDMGFSIDALQPMYNLVKRQVEVEILPMAISEGISVFSYSPLGGGLLTGKYIDGKSEGRFGRDEMYIKRYAPPWMHDAAAGLTELSRVTGTPAATLAVAWAAYHPGVTGPIISARSVEQLRPSLAALEFHMGAHLYDEISALSPAPPPATDRLEEAG